MKYNIISISDIVDNIEDSLKYNKPFSLIRFGDGGLKLIDRYYNDKSLESISDKEGIPLWFFDELISGWRKYANEANYIDSPLFYLDENSIFHRRHKVSSDTKNLMREWESVYELIGFENKNICNSEIGFMMFAENAKKNIIDLIGFHDVCCITNFHEIRNILLPYVDGVTIKIIPEFYGDFYNVCYESLVTEIKREAKEYSLWLVGAGELGRLFTGLIKEHGGRAIDIGKVFDVWVNRKVNRRMRNILRLSKNHRLAFTIGDSSETIN
jgi:hypothetical protein